MHWQLNALGPACTQRTKKGNLTGNESIVKFMDRKFLSWSEFQLMELNCRNEVKITCKMKNEKKKRVSQRKTSTTAPNPGKMQLARRKSELVERRSTF